MKRMCRWFSKYRGALYVSGAYGILAVLLYFLGSLGGGDGPLGAWYVVYFSALPVSWLFNIAASATGYFLPEKLSTFLYGISPILAGMLWAYIVSRCVFAFTARVAARRASMKVLRPAPQSSE